MIKTIRNLISIKLAMKWELKMEQVPQALQCLDCLTYTK